MTKESKVDGAQQNKNPTGIKYIWIENQKILLQNVLLIHNILRL